MSYSNNELCAKLFKLFELLENEPMRFYGDTWDDWENNTTGSQPYPCIYVLIHAEGNNKIIQYVGETVNLGTRLERHNLYSSWKPKWTHVKYLSKPDFTELRFRKLFEKMAIYLLNPTENKG